MTLWGPALPRVFFILHLPAVILEITFLSLNIIPRRLFYGDFLFVIPGDQLSDTQGLSQLDNKGWLALGAPDARLKVLQFSNLIHLYLPARKLRTRG